MRNLIQAAHSIYSSTAFALTILSGLLTITVERYIFARRDYKRDAAVTKWIGWFYIVGGTLVFIALQVATRFMM